jgi:hypothetical protein
MTFPDDPTIRGPVPHSGKGISMFHRTIAGSEEDQGGATHPCPFRTSSGGKQVDEVQFKK